MTISVYPRYVGPTIEYRYASLYPKWLGNIIDAIPVLPPIEDWLGGVVVLDVQTGVAAFGSTVAALVAAAKVNVLERTVSPEVYIREAAEGVTASTVRYGINKVSGAWGIIYATLQAGMTNLTGKRDVVRRGEVDAEVRNEDPEI